MIKFKVTIGVCVKDCEKFINNAIESIINQNFPHNLMEIIFVDDGSEDSTLKLISEKTLNVNIDVKIFSHKWMGLGPSRNIIVHEAQGEYIVWVDGDMALSKEYVKKLVEFMDNNPQVGISKGIVSIIKGSSLVASLEMMYHMTSNLQDMEKTIKPIGTGGSIYRVKAIRQIGGFNENLKGACEDVDVEFKMKQNDWMLRRTFAVFYEKCKSTWKELWIQYYWYGIGGYYLYQNNIPFRDDSNLRLFPLFLIREELYRSFIAYKLTKNKVAFLLFFHWFFKRVAWLYGLCKMSVYVNNR